MNVSECRVIIIEDEATIRFVLSKICKQIGLEVAGDAGNGEDGLALLRQTDPHLVLLDINMPIMQGDEALPVIMREKPGTTVIMLTSVAEMTTVRRCIDLGAVNYILKSTPMEDIKHRIQETVEAM
ncbi:MAG: response regulator [Spartobacteria bacterium]|nr:response regulator [Spartobacteria bacterium]